MVNLGSLFMYLEVYNYNCILCIFIFFLDWHFVCAVDETDQYHPSNSPDIAQFMQYYYIAGYFYILFIWAHLTPTNNTYLTRHDILQTEIYHCRSRSALAYTVH